MRIWFFYLVIQLTEAPLQVDGARVYKLGEHFQMCNELSVQKKTMKKTLIILSHNLSVSEIYVA